VAIALRRFATLKTREAGLSVKPEVTSVPDFWQTTQSRYCGSSGGVVTGTAGKKASVMNQF